MARTILEKQARKTGEQRFMSSEDIVGKRVKNPEGYDLGEISSLRVGLPTARVAYAVLKTGGMLGLGAKLFAIPIEAMVYRPGDEVFVVNISKHKIDSESGFTEGEWPGEASWNLIESTRPMAPPSQEEARAATHTEAASGMTPGAVEGERPIAAPGLSAADLQVYLRDMNYPAGKGDLINHAREHNAPADVIAMLEQLGDRTYQSAGDVSEEFARAR